MATTPTTLDLAAYFRRIDYSGQTAPTKETLAALVSAHTTAIPFENLTPLMGQPVHLELGALEQKLVHDGRGGYCFEQNLLFLEVLRQLGFTARGLAARVLWGQTVERLTPRSHMLVLLDLGGQPHVVDVGFGGMTLTGVLRLEPNIEQATPHEPFRLVPRNDTFVMQANVAGAWLPLYRFDLSEQHEVDYEVSNYYLYTNPTSHFRLGLMGARVTPDRRYALRDRSLTVHHLGGPSERRVLATNEELRHALETDLRITLPKTPDLDQALDRLPRP